MYLQRPILRVFYLFLSSESALRMSREGCINNLTNSCAIGCTVICMLKQRDIFNKFIYLLIATLKIDDWTKYLRIDGNMCK